MKFREEELFMLQTDLRVRREECKFVGKLAEGLWKTY